MGVAEKIDFMAGKNAGLELTKVRENWGWLVAMGIITVIIGMVAIGMPIATAIAIDLLIAWLFIFGGTVQFIHAVKSQSKRGRFLAIVTSLCALGVGILMLLYPLKGVLTLTLVLGTFFFAEGILRVAQAINMERGSGRGWILFNGIVDAFLGVLIWSRWPSSAAWLIGLLVGIDLMLSGWSMIVLAAISRKTQKAD